jgi:hypothetical protein
VSHLHLCVHHLFDRHRIRQINNHIRPMVCHVSNIFAFYFLGITTMPRLIWWPFRSLLFNSSIESYFRASFIELYILQCICENILRCSSVYLQVFARMATLDIVNHMHEHIHRKKYPLLYVLRHRFSQPWLFFSLFMNAIDLRQITQGLSVFRRQAY